MILVQNGKILAKSTKFDHLEHTYNFCEALLTYLST